MQATVHGVAKSQAQLSNFPFPFLLHIRSLVNTCLLFRHFLEVLGKKNIFLNSVMEITLEVE